MPGVFPPKSTIKGVAKEELEEATKWVGGLDRIHKTRGIQSCFDLTATPFAPTGKRSGEKLSLAGSSATSASTETPLNPAWSKRRA